MHEGIEAEVAAKFTRLSDVRHELDKLEESRKMLKRTLDAHHIPEVAAEMEKIDGEIEVLKNEEAELLK